MKALVFPAVAACILAGCASMPGLQPAVVPSTPYVAADHDPWRAEGTAELHGQAFLRQQGGGVVTCAGSTVMLVPKSPYFEDVARIIDSGRKVDPTALQGAEFPGRKSQCDAQGNFKFTALPAATWYVITKVNWTVGYASQGGELIQTVTTEDGKRSEVLLTDQNRI